MISVHTSSASMMRNRFTLSNPLTPSVTTGFSPDAQQRLAQLSAYKQWILLTAECSRPNEQQLQALHQRGHNMIQMKPSKSLSEWDIAMKAIQSGNASAVVVSNRMSPLKQRQLQAIAHRYHCEVLFVAGKSAHYH